jgi:acylglycerol lipase
VTHMKHTEGTFIGRGNLNLYYQSWAPDGLPYAALVIAHGLAEHSGRYMNVVNYFVPKGYAVCAFDLRGHGKSEGKRGYVEHFSYYLDDLKIFYDKVCQQYKNTKIFLVGHSMGGTIAAAYASQHQSELDGLILSAAVSKAGESINSLSILATRILSVILPKMGVTVLDASTISQDKAVVDAYVNDPLVYRGKITARMGAELLNIIGKLPSIASGINLPTLVMHGSADRLSSPDGSRMLFEHIQAKDKTLIIYESFYHEIFNEPGRQQVFDDMHKWIAHHV